MNNQDTIVVTKPQSAVIMVPLKSVKADLVTENKTVVYVPLASRETFGVVKIGEGLNIDNGLLSLDRTEIPILSISKNGNKLYPDANKNVNIQLIKSDVGLGNVDNTSDEDKPVSKLQQEALNKKLDKYQGIENSGKILTVETDGTIGLRQKFGTLSIYQNDVLINSDVETLNFTDMFLTTSSGNKVTIDGSSKLKSVIKDVSYDGSTGILSFVSYNGDIKNIDLPLELIVTGGYYDEYLKDIVLVLANGDKINIPIDDIVTVWKYSEFVPGTETNPVDMWRLTNPEGNIFIGVAEADLTSETPSGFLQGFYSTNDMSMLIYQNIDTEQFSQVGVGSDTLSLDMISPASDLVYHFGFDEEAALWFRTTSTSINQIHMVDTGMQLQSSNNDDKAIVLEITPEHATLNDKRILTELDAEKYLTTDTAQLIEGSKIFVGGFGISASDGADVAQIRNYGTAISILGGDGRSIFYLNEVDKTASAFTKRLAYYDELVEQHGTKVTINNEFQETWNADLKADKTELDNYVLKTNNMEGYEGSILNGGKMISMHVQGADNGSVFGMSSNSLQMSIGDMTNESSVIFTPESIDFDTTLLSYNGSEIATKQDIAQAGGTKVKVAGVVQPEWDADSKLNVSDIDNTLSETSKNPVQNKVIASVLNDKLNIPSDIININKSEAFNFDSYQQAMVCYGGNKYIALPNHIYNGALAKSSNDGITWTSMTLYAPNINIYAYHNIVYGNGVFVMGGSNKIIYSSNGSDWSESSNGTIYISPGGNPRLAFGNGVFVNALASDSGTSQYSLDGINWTDVNLFPNHSNYSSYWKCVIFDDMRKKFFAYTEASGTPLYYSENGIDWIFDSTIDVVAPRHVTLSKENIMVMGGTKAYISKYYGDFSWNEITTFPLHAANDVEQLVYYPDIEAYVALSNQGYSSEKIYYSFDGFNWKTVDTNGLQSLTDSILVNDTIFLGGDDSDNKPHVLSLIIKDNSFVSKPELYDYLRLNYVPINGDKTIYGDTTFVGSIIANGDIETPAIKIGSNWFSPEHYLNKENVEGLETVNSNVVFTQPVTSGYLNTDDFVLGSLTGKNLSFGADGIQARQNGHSASPLYLNYYGGNVEIGSEVYDGKLAVRIPTVIDGKLIVNPYGSTNSYNEGIRVGNASNGWSEINLGCNAGNSYGVNDGMWIIGKRGEADTTASVGDLSITYSSSSTGAGLALHKNGYLPTWFNKKLLSEVYFGRESPDYEVLFDGNQGAGTINLSRSIYDFSMVAVFATWDNGTNIQVAYYPTWLLKTAVDNQNRYSKEGINILTGHVHWDIYRADMGGTSLRSNNDNSVIRLILGIHYH